MVYFGSVLNRGRALVDYLTSVSGLRIPRRTNPANWMLNVIDNKFTSDAPVDFGALYIASPMKQYVDDCLASHTVLCTREFRDVDPPSPPPSPSSLCQQLDMINSHDPRLELMIRALHDSS